MSTPDCETCKDVTMLVEALREMVTCFAGFITDVNEAYEIRAIAAVKAADAAIAKAEGIA